MRLNLNKRQVIGIAIAIGVVGLALGLVLVIHPHFVHTPSSMNTTPISIKVLHPVVTPLTKKTFINTSQHANAVKRAGTVAWGYLPTGGKGMRLVTVPNGLRNVFAIAAGYDHITVLTTDPSVCIWKGNFIYK
jgi:hypothetical protein